MKVTGKGAIGKGSEVGKGGGAEGGGAEGGGTEGGGQKSTPPCSCGVSNMGSMTGACTDNYDHIFPKSNSRGAAFRSLYIHLLTNLPLVSIYAPKQTHYLLQWSGSGLGLGLGFSQSRQHTVSFFGQE